MTLFFFPSQIKVDYTWKVNDVGKCRLVIFPSDPDFVVGTYMIGVFSVVPARFEILADISGGAYSSESVRNVERLTAKFNTVAEGGLVAGRSYWRAQCYLHGPSALALLY